MNRIDKLIKELCPGGVEFKALSDIAELVRGNGMPKSDFADKGVGCIHYGQIYTHYGTWATEIISRVPEEKAVKLAKVEPGDLIVTNTSENLDDVGKAVAWLGNEMIVTGGHATVVKPSIDPKYLAYWFQSPAFYAEKVRHATGAKVIDVSARKLEKVRVPVPPVEVQREIVRTLDEYSGFERELSHQLEAELEARRWQYEHYRDALLKFPDARRAQMGAVGRFVRGRRFTKKDIVPSGIPSIHYGDIYTHYGVSAVSAVNHVRDDLAPQLRYAHTGDVVIACVGETVEDVGKAVAWLGNEDVAIHDDTFLFRGDLHPKYVAYLVQTADFNSQKAHHVARGKVKRLSSSGLARIEIPIPSLAEQEHVVALLDKFNALINNLGMVLPAERTNRYQQYEHYRDRLLTFKEA